VTADAATGDEKRKLFTIGDQLRVPGKKHRCQRGPQGPHVFVAEVKGLGDKLIAGKTALG
jgi:hypothetical protein